MYFYTLEIVEVLKPRNRQKNMTNITYKFLTVPFVWGMSQINKVYL